MTERVSLRDEIALCLSRGMSSAEIQDRFAGRRTPGCVAVTMSKVRRELALPAEPHTGRARQHFAFVRLTADVDAFLSAEAAERGVTTSELAMRLLETVAVDALVDAVLDDGAAR